MQNTHDLLVGTLSIGIPSYYYYYYYYYYLFIYLFIFFYVWPL